MRSRLAVVPALALLLAASPVRADEPLVGTLRKVSGLFSESEQGEIRRKLAQARAQIEAYIDVANAFLANNEPIDMRVDALVEVGAGADRTTAEGEGTAGLMFAIRSERCDLVQVGVGLRGDLRSKDPRTLGGAQQWGQICLAGGLDVGQLMQADAAGIAIFPMTLREGGLLDARPRLTAPRAEIDEPYSLGGFGFDVEGARYLWAKERGLAFVGFTADQNWRWRGFPTGDKAKVELTGDFWFVRLFRTRGPEALADRFIDILVFGFHGIQADNGAAIVDVWPVRFYGIGFADQVLVDAELGVGGTGTITSSTKGPGVNEMTTIDTTGLPHVTAAIAHVALHGGEPRQLMSVAYDRTIDTNVLADVVREDRFSISGQTTQENWLARGAVFVSRSRYYLDESKIADERVAGFALTGSKTLAHQLSLGVTLEGVVGLVDRDPALDGHALPRGLRGFVTLGMNRTLWSQ